MPVAGGAHKGRSRDCSGRLLLFKCLSQVEHTKDDRETAVDVFGYSNACRRWSTHRTIERLQWTSFVIQMPVAGGAHKGRPRDCSGRLWLFKCLSQVEHTKDDRETAVDVFGYSFFAQQSRYHGFRCSSGGWSRYLGFRCSSGGWSRYLGFRCFSGGLLV
ncbi:hypothetical protein ACOMHN_059410 [Nucella lapillus]